MPMIKKALAVIAAAGTAIMAAPVVATADTPAASPVTAGSPDGLGNVTSGLGLNNLLSDKGLLAPNTLLGNIAGKNDSVLTNLVQPNNGDVLKTLGQGLSGLTSDCNTILGPLTGARTGVVTTSLLNKGKLLGDLTDYRSGSLNNLTFDAFYGQCQKLGNSG